MKGGGQRSAFRLSSEIIIPREGSGGLKWTTDAADHVVDGRDAFLAWCIARTSGDPGAAFDLFAQHADLTRPRRDSRVPWTLKDAEAKAKTFERKQRRGALPNRKVKGRPANGDWSGAPWSAADVEAFNERIRQLCLKGDVSRAEMKVSVAMAGFLPERGQCFAAVERIAKEAGVSVSTVKQARPALERYGLWRSAGSTGKTAVYVPRFNRAQGTDPAREKVEAVHTSTPYNTSMGPEVLVRGLEGMAPSNDNRWSAKATWVRKQRQRLGLSQRALARRIGCRQPHLANVERGHDRLGKWPSRRLRELIKEAA